MTTPSILIVNDDSIFSEGIKALWEAMTEIWETTVVAPKFAVLEPISILPKLLEIAPLSSVPTVVTLESVSKADSK